MSQKHILLADADARTLDEFRTALDEQWIVKAVANGAAVLEELKAQEYDGLVAGMHLPDMGTSQLFNKVRGKFPKTVRFVVASESDRERVVKEVLGAHQFLIRPFDADGLRTVIERALAFDLWIDSDKLHKLVARMRSLPTVPALYLEILAALRSSDTTTDEVGEMIAKDMAITTKLLQVINSAYFGLPRTVTSPSEAVALLGFETVKSMVMAVKLLNHYDRLKTGNFSVERLWQHSTAVANNARRLILLQTGEQAVAEEAFAAGLLHDVGKAVLAANFCEQYQGAQSLARKQRIPMWEVEKEIFGASHGEVGAYLLGLWGLPLGVLEAAALHHQPGRATDKVFSALSAVHVGNVLEHELSLDLEGEALPAIDMEYLAEIGMLECLPAWREEILGPDAVAENSDEEAAQSRSPLPRPNLTSAPPPAASLTGADETPALTFIETPADSAAPTEEPVVAQSDTPAETSAPLEEDEAKAPSPEVDPNESEVVSGSVQLDPATFSDWQRPNVENEELATAHASGFKSTTPWIVVAAVVLLGFVITWLVTGKGHGQNPNALVVRAQPIKAPVVVKAPEAAGPVEPRQAPPQTPQRPVETNSPAGLSNTNLADPSGLTPSTSSPALSVPPEIVFPEVRLQGVLFSQGNPSAIINGAMVHNKDLILGVRIVEIKPTSVVIEYQHQRKTLSLE